MDPAVSVTRMPTRQAFDLSGQGWLVSPLLPAVPKSRASAIHQTARFSLRDPEVLAQEIRGGSLLVWRHHFFFAIS
jgi:hypothetical protein